MSLIQKIKKHLSSGDLLKVMLNIMRKKSHIWRSLELFLRNYRPLKNKYKESAKNIWLNSAYKSFSFENPVLLGELDKDVLILKVGKNKVLWPKNQKLNELTWLEQELNVPYWRNPHSYNKKGFFINKNMTVLDFGACEGLFTLNAASKGAKVYAVEPNPILSKLLNKTLELNRFTDRAIVVPLAFDNKSYIGDFLIDENVSTSTLVTEGNHQSTISVNVKTLDDFFIENNLSKVDLIKLDVEGWEERIIEGGWNTINKHKPKIAVAVYHDPEQWKRVKELIKSIRNDYQFHLRGMALRPSKEDIPRPMMLFAW